MMKDPRTPMARWIFEEYNISEKSLGISRILFALSLLIFCYPRYLWMAKFPASFYTPSLSLGVFFRQQPSALILLLFTALLMVLSIGLLVGWKTRAVGLGLAGLLVVGNTFDYSFGKINHDILLIAVLVTMSFSGWGKKYSVDVADGEGESPRWPLALLALIIGLAMWSAAMPKIESGWLNLSTQSAKGHIIYNVYATERPTLLAQWLLAHGSTWFWEFIDWSTIAIEMAFLAAMFSKRALRVVCALAIFFHAGIHFSMDIFFIENLMAYSMLVEWERGLKIGWVRHALESWERRCSRLRGWIVVLTGLAAAGLYALIGNPFAKVLSSFGDGHWIGASLCIVGASVLAGTYLVKRILNRWAPLGKGKSNFEPINAELAQVPVILFDGVCGLCNRFVDFVLKQDRRKVFRFAPLQSATGQTLLDSYGLPTTLSSIVLIQKGQAYRYSAATLEIFRQLGLPWSLLYLFILVPPVLRDLIYETIANNRYEWFNQRESCRIPSAEERVRFLY